jgi:Putative addiction module component
MTHSRPRRRLPAAPPNNGMQRTALRAAADAERSGCYNGGMPTREPEMSIQLPLDTMTVAEKVQLLETVWESLCRESGDVRSPAWHREVLDERTRRLQSGQATVSSWSDAKARLLKVPQ